MTTLILCGGHGWRIKGHFDDVPKPLVPLRGKPLLYYIIDGYRKYGVTHFVLLVGNNENLFTEFAASYEATDIIIEILQTGINTLTGGRIKKAESLLEQEETFFLTYGDGIADIDFAKQMDFHQQHQKTATLTAIRPRLPFGLLDIDDLFSVLAFTEKPVLEKYINGGFFVLNRDVFTLLDENSDFETEILPLLSKENKLNAFIHNGFWQNMDTFKDYLFLDGLELEKILF